MRKFRIIQFDQLESTNTYARLHLRELEDGDVIQAARQTHGRGRLDHTWVSGPGDLCLSIVLKPGGRDATRANEPNTASYIESLACLSHLAAVCLCRVLDGYGVQGQIKWPNDVLTEGRKFAGILAESIFLGREFLGLVLGIGANINMDPNSLAMIEPPATSLRSLLGRPVDANEFRDALLKQFAESSDALLHHGFSVIRSEYLSRAMFLGKRVEMRGPRLTHSGTAVDITDDGALVLEDGDGRRSKISIGEMFLPSRS